MIVNFIENDWCSILLVFRVISVCAFSVLLAVGVDLYFGIKKAKQLGECTTSEGFRRTINKLTYYFALLFFGILLDIFDVITPYMFSGSLGKLPFVTMLISVGLIITEIKSVRENAEDKVRRRSDESIKQMIDVLIRKEEAVEKLVDRLSENSKKENDNE